MSEEFVPDNAHATTGPIQLKLHDLDEDTFYVYTSRSFNNQYQSELQGAVTKEALLRRNSRYGPITGTLLPPGCIGIGGDYVLLQEPPTRRVVSISSEAAPGCECAYEACECNSCLVGDYCGEDDILVEECLYCMGEYEVESELYDLPFPWMSYLVSTRDQASGVMWTGMSAKSIESMDDFTLSPPLPNIWDNGTVCIGNAVRNYWEPRPPEPAKNSAELVTDAIVAFWGSNFNQDVVSWRNHPLMGEIHPGYTKGPTTHDFFTAFENLSIEDIIDKVENFDFESVLAGCRIKSLFDKYLSPKIDASVGNLFHHFRSLV